MFNRFPIFKAWVPEWLVKISLYSILLPSIVLFFLPLANVNAAAGYYGCEPLDIYFSVALFYSGYVGFYALERRFFAFFAAKEYFILFVFLTILSTYLCYLTNITGLFFALRFIQGMLFSSSVNLSLSIIFTRLKSERAREIGFSVFFGTLICALPFNYFVTADLIDAYDFNIVYKIATLAYIPGLLMIIISMNNIHLAVQFPLRKLDWQSFVLYTIILILASYCLIFGQEYYWLSDNRIRYAVFCIIALGILFFYRQRSMKRPYISMSVFYFRNFVFGIFLLFVMYICRFSLGISNAYFTTVLELDPIHISYLNLFNLLGLVAGVFVSCIYTIQNKDIRFIWISGFSFLLFFHFTMLFLFNPDANEYYFYIPLFLQGLGVGFLMVPIILFSISSVPKNLSSSAASIALAVRFLGFCSYVALINFFELYGKSKHFNTFQDNITYANPVVRQIISHQNQTLLSHGLNQNYANKGARKIIVERMSEQNHLRFALDYYEMMVALLLLTILLIALFPRLNRTVIYLKSKVITPA